MQKQLGLNISQPLMLFLELKTQGINKQDVKAKVCLLMFCLPGGHL